ncbi:MAG: 16S rRNA (adenine(1518)-N(6)/adenine(1519)-N(6))-dimethyltransferase RsmA [Patescibacteria group bacterium]|nr:16S rRNA (adenine(1518)-N(6)/adenine(1519)-N(6))-dimethyltransferase RsmA [Patescibacteria group bacterium]
MLNIAHRQHLVQLLKKHNLWAKKDFGQNYLVDENILLDIVEGANITSDDTVLEIGPGPGALTQKLCSKADSVTALELDRETIPVLTDTDSCGSFENLTVHQQDALLYTPEWKDYKVVANIPYYITGKILRYYIGEVENKPKSLTMLMQKEVVDKIVTSKNESALSLFCKAFGDVSIIRMVPPEAFHPAPKVTSAVFHIDIFPQPKIQNISIEEYSDILDKLFIAPRKQIHNNITQGLGLDTQKAKELL